MDNEILLTEFDKPYDANLIKLKDELAADVIDFKIEGEEGNIGNCDALTFEIRIFIDLSRHQEANQIKKNIEDEMKR